MKTLVIRLVVLILAIAVIGGGIALAQRNGKAKKDDTTYELGKVEPGDVRSFVSASGTIQAWKTVDVKSNVAGRIDRLYVDLGDTVKKGQPIADIDPTDTRTSFNQAVADLRAAKAKSTQATASVDQQRAQTKARIAGAGKAIMTAEARLAEAQANFATQPKLTKASIAQANASLSSAKRAVEQAENNKQQLEESLQQLVKVTIPLDIESVDSNVDQAVANMQTSQAEYNRQVALLAKGYVAQGDVETAQARLATQKANVRTAKQRQLTLKLEHESTVREMRARIAQADAAIKESESRVHQAEASLELAKQNAVQDEVRRHERNAAQAAVEQARAELEAARADLKQIEVRKQDYVSAEAQIVRSEAARNQASINLGYTRIVAPRDGVILTKNVEEGTVIPSSRGSIGSTNAMILIGDISKLWIVCKVDETDISQVIKNQKVTIKVDAYPSRVIEGKVIRIDPQAVLDQNVTLIPVTVEIDDPDPLYKPGMNAECEFIVDEVTNVLTVPNEALKEQEGAFVVQQLVNGQPKDIPVEVGLAGQDRTEIKSGLKEGEEVIIKTIKAEKPQTTNPFGNPFGGPPRRPAGGAGGGAGGAGGGRGGGR